MLTLVPGRLRPVVRPLLGVAAALFAVLAALVWHGHRALAADVAVQGALGVPSWAQRSQQHVGDLLGGLGSTPAVLIISAALATATWRRRGADLRALALCAVALPVAIAAEVVVKPLVGRRYYGTAYRFPSGRVAVVPALAVVAWFLLAAAASRATRWLAGLLGVATVAAVSWAVLVTRAHTPIDVLGAVVLGAGFALGAAAALDAAVLDAGSEPPRAARASARPSRGTMGATPAPRDEG